jgi:hypothetical protein
LILFFTELPDDEKKFWHSHVQEVKSGSLICPTSSVVPRMAGDRAEMAYMEELIDTYGKVCREAFATSKN